MSARANTILSAAAAVVAVTGILLTIGSIRATPAARAQMARRAGDLAQLQALSVDARRAEEALRARAAMGRERALPVEDLLMSAFPGLEAQVQPREKQPLGDGWFARTVEVVLEEAPLAGIGKLAEEGGALRPPWRVAELSIVASDRPGIGRVTLVLEAIEKDGA
jgi:hypothetical protein